MTSPLAGSYSLRYALALFGAGALVVSREVVEISVPDKPGALAGVAALLAARGINLSYAYGSAGGAGTAHLYVRVPDGSAADVDRMVGEHLAKG